MKFYKCELCGQMFEIDKPSGVIPYCCGSEVTLIKAKENESELKEKHVPTYTRNGHKVVVNIGTLPHPSNKEHYIEWIMLVTNMGHQKKCLKPGMAPEAVFLIEDDEEVEEIYAFCNIHSLWVKRV